jgi:NADH-quinone oxidoreductase subunit L
MPGTYRTFLIGSLALAGIFPLAGFWSKDEILASIQYDATSGAGGSLASFVLIVAIVGAFVTAFYMARTVYLTFFGEYKGHGHPHDPKPVMLYPLYALAFFAVVAGFVNMPGIFTGFTDWVGTRMFAAGDHHAESLDLVLAVIGLAAAGAGIALGTRLWRGDAATQAERDRFRIAGLFPFLERKYFIDDLYMGGIVEPIKGPIARFVNWTNTYIIDSVVNGVAAVSLTLGRFVYGGLDQRGIDLAANAIAGGASEAGEALRYTTSGKVQQYVGAVFLGAIVLVVGFLIVT